MLLAFPARAHSRWIVSRRVDLVFIVASAAAGYFFLLLNVAVGVPASFLWWFWSIGFDGTHIFAMATRTYFDAEARRVQRRLLFGSLAVFFSLGPIMVLAGQKALLALLVGVWAYYHVIRQHYGFLVLYRVKNQERSGMALDRLLLGVMTIAPPFHRFFIHHPAELGLPQRFALTWLELPLWALVGATALLYAAALLKRAREGAPAFNLPKLLLLGGIIPLHWLTFRYMSWQAAVPTVTIVHNLQYHALVWFHNSNRYVDDSRGRIPRALATHLAWYIGAALVFSAAYRIPGHQLGRISDLAFGLFCGFGLTHYYLDSRIWRVRTDPSLKQALKLAA